MKLNVMEKRVFMTMMGVRRTLRSPASVPRQRRGGLALARSARAVKCDGYLKHRARQVQQLVLPHER